MKVLLPSVLATGGVILTLFTATPAHAATHVYSKALTPGSSVGGGSVSSDISFPADRTRATFGNFTINDVCDGNGNGDGNYAGGRAVVRYQDGTNWYGPWRLDTRSCDNAPLNLGTLGYDGSKIVSNAGVQGVVMNGTSTTSVLAVGGIDWAN